MLTNDVVSFEQPGPGLGKSSCYGNILLDASVAQLV